MALIVKPSKDPKVTRWWWRTLRQWIYELVDPLWAAFRAENSADIALTNLTSINGVSANELDYLAGLSEPGIAVASKAVVLDANKDVSGKRFDINRSLRDAIANGPSYKFDGVDDYVSIADDANFNFGASGDFSLECWLRTAVTPTDFDRLIDHGINASGAYQLALLAVGTVYGYVFDGVTTVQTVSTTVVTDGEWHHVVYTADRDGNGIIYVDGVAENSDAISAVGDIDQAKPLTLGIRADDLASNPTDVDMEGVTLYNRALTATEVLDLASGMPVPYSDVGANNTNLITLWTNKNFDTFTFSGVDITQAAGNNAAENCYQNGALLLDVSKQYRLSFTVTAGPTNIDNVYLGLSLDNSLNGAQQLFSANIVAGNNSVQFTPTSAWTYIGFRLITDVATDFAVTNFEIYPIGAVLQLEPDGIGSTFWYDKSGNGLHGTVNGATPLNLPIAYVNDAGRHMLEGDENGRGVLRFGQLQVQPGATPGTNLNVTYTPLFNDAAVSNAADLAAGGSAGSFSLSADGKAIIISVEEDIIGASSIGMSLHDINSSSTSDLYFIDAVRTGTEISFYIRKRGPNVTVDWRTIMDAGDIARLNFLYITSS